MPPNMPAASPIFPFNPLISEISSCIAFKLGLFNVARVLSKPSCLRAQIRTVAPSARKALAIANPIPLVPPVTTTFFPSNLALGALYVTFKFTISLRLNIMRIACLILSNILINTLIAIY